MNNDVKSISQVEADFLYSLKYCIMKENPNKEMSVRKEIVDIAEKSKVLPLFYNEFLSFSDEDKKRVNLASRQCANRFYKLLQITLFLQNYLKNNGVECAVLKGVDVAGYYDIPEYRHFGDVDLFIKNKEEMNHVTDLFAKIGINKADEQSSDHHISYQINSVIEVEVHFFPVSLYSDSSMNLKLEELYCNKDYHFEKKTFWGRDYYALPDYLNAVYLLLHMAQHMLTAGFGVRLLCDWVFFWGKEKSEETYIKYLDTVKYLGLDTFSNSITAVCVEYLGLDKERGEAVCGNKLQTVSKTLTDILLAEVMDSGYYGEVSNSRLVALRKNSIWEYGREFHHQTKRNYPTLSKIVIIWPVLWTFSFFRFIYNNYSIRRVKTIDVLKNSKKRSKLIEKLGL